MKLIQKILTAAAALGCAVGTALAQGNFDYFGGPKTLELVPPQTLTQSGITILAATNVANIARFLGIVSLDLSSISNANQNASGYSATNGFTLLTSPTGTNQWSPITNVFFATTTTIIYSNLVGTAYGNTNYSWTYYTNTWQVPGTLSNLTASVMGYSGQATYPPIPTTGTASATASTTWTVGFDADNASTFLGVAWSLSGSNAVYSVNGVLRGRTKQGQY
jgi:hypothetical protein